VAEADHFWPWLWVTVGSFALVAGGLGVGLGYLWGVRDARRVYQRRIDTYAMEHTHQTQAVLQVMRKVGRLGRGD
jgi:hypothetical protein